jgi:hypothetical protein
MDNRDQLRKVCRWNRTLARENALLRQRVGELEREAANEGCLREASDILLGTAMDELLAARDQEAS